jgi:hypothetical protein
MKNDPIVDEIHEVREKLLTECNGDIDKYFERLREKEGQEKGPVISIDEYRNEANLAH